MLPALPAVGIPVVSGQLFHCLFGYLWMYLIIWQRGIKKDQWSTLGGSIGTRDRALSTWCFVFAVVIRHIRFALVARLLTDYQYACAGSPPPMDFIPRSSSLVGYASAESTPASPPPKVTLTPSTDGPLASASATRGQCGTNDGTSVVVTSLETCARNITVRPGPSPRGLAVNYLIGAISDSETLPSYNRFCGINILQEMYLMTMA
ncbi:hypothetical protein DL95DRAFT_406895 [Leptodontidium sp. 2 PMI_412]|nr:hypothetical protein DL95DRAFT_406895 [Leptodontidium sp. 2 PMI_412]